MHVPTSVFIRGDRRYLHLLTCFDTRLLARLFGSVTRNGSGESRGLLSPDRPAPAKGGPDAELKRLARAKKLPPFLIRTF